MFGGSFVYFYFVLMSTCRSSRPEGGKVKNALRVVSYVFRYTSYEFKSTGYEFKFTSYEFKSTS